MPVTAVYDALVLRAFDVGESDRFCMLLTREIGKIAVRACGVRRVTSRMGSAFIPFSRARISVKDLPRGMLAVAAVQQEPCLPRGDLPAFFRAEAGVELLLALLHDGEPMPSLFDDTVSFLSLCGRGEHVLFAYAFRLFHTLGFLPDPQSENAIPLSPSERQFISASCTLPLSHISPPTTETLRWYCGTFLAEHFSHPLRAWPYGENTCGTPQGVLRNLGEGCASRTRFTRASAR